MQSCVTRRDSPPLPPHGCALRPAHEIYLRGGLRLQQYNCLLPSLDRDLSSHTHTHTQDTRQSSATSQCVVVGREARNTRGTVNERRMVVYAPARVSTFQHTHALTSCAMLGMERGSEGEGVRERYRLNGEGERWKALGLAARALQVSAFWFVCIVRGADALSFSNSSRERLKPQRLGVCVHCARRGCAISAPP